MRSASLAVFLPRRSCWRLLKLVSALLLLGLPGTTRSQQPDAADSAEPVVDVLTNHNDNARTGANLRETRLNTQNVGQPEKFGKLFSLTVDGQVYAQPLVKSHVEIAGKGVHNVVFIATAHDSVYAFDADDHQGANAQPLWHVRFVSTPGDPAAPSVTLPPAKTTPVRSADYDSFIAGAYHDLTPEIGIIGTPVLDPTTNRLFVVAAMREKGRYAQYLHALDVSSGRDSLPPVEISGSVEGIGDGGANNRIPFEARQHLQRPGLLLAPDGVVYVAFGSHGDLPVNGFTLSNLFNLLPGYHGWIFAYDAKTLTPLGIYNSTPNGGTSLLDLFKAQATPAGGGIWMSGAGPAADAAGNVYFSTGNGTFDAPDALGGHSDYGDSIVKLRLDRNAPFEQRLRVDSYFTPANQAFLNDKDLDLGSCGILLLPEGSKEHPELLVGGGKQGKMYLVDRRSMGGFDPAQDSCVQNFLAAFSTKATVKAQKREGQKPPSEKERKGQTHHRVQTTMAHKQLSSDDGLSNIHSAPVYWRSSQGAHVYIWGEVDVLKAFPFMDGSLQPERVAKSEVKLSDGMPGGMLSLSANGDDADTGILWASHPYHGDANHATVQGVLQAFCATPALPGTKLYALDADAPGDNSPRLALLWDSRKNQADDGGTFAKFCPPTVANGKVYLPSFSGQVSVYGLLDKRQVVYATADAFVQAGASRTQALSARPHKPNTYDPLSELLFVGRVSNDSASIGNTCSYLQFDLTDTPFTPQSAMLTLTVPKSAPVNASTLVQVYAVKDAAFDPATLAWNNAPALNREAFQSTGELVAWHRIAPKSGRVTFDLTNFITSLLKAGGTKRITLQLMSMNPDHISVDFISSRLHPLNHAGEPFLTLVSYPK